MKINHIICFFIIASPLFLSAQIAPDVYLIEFTDKDQSEYTINHPEDFLSQRAIERRERYNIPVNETDLPVNQEYIDSLQNMGIQVLHASKWLNSVTVHIDSADVLNSLTEISFVKHVAKKGSNIKSSGINKFEEEDHFFNLPGDMSKRLSIVQHQSLDYGAYTYQMSMLSGQYLHNKGFKGEDMIIAVNDAGFYRADVMQAFDSLRNRNGILGVQDFVSFDDSVYHDHYHGAYVLSIIAANIPGEAIGTAPNANFYLFRTEDTESEYPVEEENWIRAIEYADSVGADILTSSVSYYLFDDSTLNHTYNDLTGNTTRITRAADFAAAKGMLVVNSAGNEGNKLWKYITFPSDGDSVLSVGAVDSAGIIAPFSSIGPSDYHIVKPNIAALGVNTYIHGISNTILRSSGTSYSTPMIAGLAACLWQAFPNKTNYEIIKAMEQSASFNQNPNQYYGYGVPNFTLAYHILEGTTIVEQSEDITMRIFPNPVYDRLNIEITNKNEADVEIIFTDILGKRIYEDFFHTNSTVVEFTVTDLQFLPEGIYFLNIAIGDKQLTRKIVKKNE